MDKVNTTMRRRAVQSALGSVRAEGLRPSAKTKTQLMRYADGKISAKGLKSNVLREVRRKK